MVKLYCSITNCPDNREMTCVADEVFVDGTDGALEVTGCTYITILEEMEEPIEQFNEEEGLS